MLVYPSVPLKANVTYQAIASGTQPGAIMDLAGNPLNSVFNAVPAVDFISPVARGTKITYAEGTQVITLQIQGGGIIDLSDFALNQAPTVQVLGGVPHRTIGHALGGFTRFHQILGLEIRRDQCQAPRRAILLRHLRLYLREIGRRPRRGHPLAARRCLEGRRQEALRRVHRP